MLEKEIILIKDLGMRFPTQKSKRKYRFGLYKCYCGSNFKAKVDHIKNKNTKSCGCYQKKRTVETSETHGLTKHRLYKTWNGMMQRCYNKKVKSYIDYGSRGIIVCNRWKDIHNFIEDMYPTFKEGLTLDRKDANGNYEKDNCRWADKLLQAQNGRKIISTNKSGYRGVSFSKKSNKWISQISLNNKKIRIGSFATSFDAAWAYDKYIIDNKSNHTKNFE